MVVMKGSESIKGLLDLKVLDEMMERNARK